MPWIECENQFAHAEHYQIDRVCAAVGVTGGDVDWAIGRKRELATLKDDASLPKDLRREHAKSYKGFCHLLAYIASKPPGDCEPDKITKELAPYADRAWQELYFR